MYLIFLMTFATALLILLGKPYAGRIASLLAIVTLMALLLHHMTDALLISL